MKLLKILSLLFIMAFALVSCDKITLTKCATGETVRVYQYQVQKYLDRGYTEGGCDRTPGEGLTPE